MDIPSYLIDQVREGKVVLFLGAGASYGATSPSPPHAPPTGVGLASLLSDKFLGGQAKDKPLTVVAEYCIARSDWRTVQHFIADMFSPFKPSPAQLKIPSFRWAALVTTNYDQILERAYAETPARLQSPVPLLKNTDRVDYELRGADRVPLLKLHGCISLVDDDRYPLILTIDQYVTHRKGRDKLFARFSEYASEYTFIFVGYRLEDTDIRAILLELASPEMSRPRHYVITPGASDLDKEVWESKKITTIDATFEEFIVALDEKMPAAFRARVSSSTTHPISAKFSSHAALSQSTLSFLLNDATYIHPGMATEPPDARAFFRGASYGWSGIVAGFDSKRNLTDTVLSEVVLQDEVDRPRRSDFYVVKGYAGAGKTVVLKRIAYEAGVTFSKPTLFLRADGRLAIDPIDELCRLLGERLYLFIDGAARRTSEIESFIKLVRSRQLQLTILVAERGSEWNVECQELATQIDDEYQLRSLSHNEIDELLKTLANNGALGVLEHKSLPEQRQAFVEYADRQLLVAMYEVTSGKSFPDIVFDEYRNIVSDRARRIYLVVCALNRLGVPVRAGIVNRVCGVSFRDFKEQFFSPLESIVLTEEYKPALDMAYRSRHPWIAQIVFERALPREADRFDLYIAIIKALDVGYTADRTAFRDMIRARNLLDLFPTPRLVDELFAAAAESNDRDAYLLQQRAIYEMKRDSGNLRKAYELLQRARELIPSDRSILHSMSELELVRARTAQTRIERDRHIEQASDFARMLTNSSADSSHGHSTLVKLAMEKFRETLESGTGSDEDLASQAKAVENALGDGLQRFRSDEFLLTAEAEFAQLLNNNARALKSLQKAFDVNPASAFVSRSLSRVYETIGELGKARETLTKSRNMLPGDKGLNAGLGRLLDRYFPDEAKEAEACWRRSFTSGDTNYAFQFSYARRLYLNGKKDEAFAVFSLLKVARVHHDVRVKIAGWLREGGKIKRHTGVIQRIEDNYAWVVPTGQSKGVYLHRSYVEAEQWDRLRSGDAIEFALGFNYMGPAASLTHLENGTLR